MKLIISFISFWIIGISLPTQSVNAATYPHAENAISDVGVMFVDGPKEEPNIKPDDPKEAPDDYVKRLLPKLGLSSVNFITLIGVFATFLILRRAITKKVRNRN